MEELVVAIKEMLDGFGLDLEFDFDPIMKVLDALKNLFK